MIEPDPAPPRAKRERTAAGHFVPGPYRTREEQNEANNIRRKERGMARRNRLIEMSGGCCQLCGSTEKLEFDHINRDRDFCLSVTIYRFTWERILEEWAKCQLLCRECHIKKSVDEGSFGWNKIEDWHGTEVGRKRRNCKCDDCREAAYQAEVRRGKNPGTSGRRPARLDEYPHGTRQRYRRDNCRCDLCIQANRDYSKKCRDERKGRGLSG